MDSPTSIQNKLKKKFGISKTGGKGSVRRKKKNVKVRLSDTIISNNEKQHNQFINNINKSLKNIDNDHIDIVNNYISEWCFDSVDNLRKKDFNKTLKNQIEISTLRETYEAWFVNNILDMDNNNTKLKTNYKFYNTTFSPQGYIYLKNAIEDLDKNIKDKKYVFDDKENESEINATELLIKLNLDSNSIPTKSELKKAYFKMSAKYHPDKNQDNMEECSKMFKDLNDAYKKLLFYYHNETNKHLYL